MKNECPANDQPEPLSRWGHPSRLVPKNDGYYRNVANEKSSPYPAALGLSETSGPCEKLFQVDK